LFRDFDSDYGDGIPVCGGCGGLGVIPVERDEAFIARAREILDLRFKFCPLSGPVPDSSERIVILGELAQKIKLMIAAYGSSDHSCFARVSEDYFSRRIQKLRSLN